MLPACPAEIAQRCRHLLEMNPRVAAIEVWSGDSRVHVAERSTGDLQRLRRAREFVDRFRLRAAIRRRRPNDEANRWCDD